MYQLCRCVQSWTTQACLSKPLGIQGPSSLWISAANGGCGGIQLAFFTVTQAEGGNQETGLSQNHELTLLSPLPDMWSPTPSLSLVLYPSSPAPLLQRACVCIYSLTVHTTHLRPSFPSCMAMPSLMTMYSSCILVFLFHLSWYRSIWSSCIGVWSLMTVHSFCLLVWQYNLSWPYVLLILPREL